ITIEDPIEYYHDHNKAIITQREIGVDVPGFAEGLRRALRMDPDVILVGEMRDLETISAAITAAETGHLVFGTLHTTGAARTVDRIIDAFPTNQQEMVRSQLSVSLLAVVSQQLMPKADGSGIVAGFEIMIMTDAIANMIRENKTYHITSAIQTGSKNGMVLLDDHLFNLFTSNLITYDVMLAKASNPDDLQVKLKELADRNARARKARG
ncbi:MAG: type IV pilus twitching motility protein PilT, partial [Planctomycetota bacterium]